MINLHALVKKAGESVPGILVNGERSVIEGGHETIVLYSGHSHKIWFPTEELEMYEAPQLLERIVVQLKDFKSEIDKLMSEHYM